MPYADPKRKREYDRQRREREGDKLRGQALAYYYRNREARLAQIKATVDPDAKAAYDREYAQREGVREQRAAQRRAWSQANPEKTKAHNRERSLTRRRARPDDEALSYMAILDGDPCAYCGTPREQTDHIVPLASGGGSDWMNLTATCQRCNYAKRDRSLLSFLLSHPHAGGY